MGLKNETWKLKSENFTGDFPVKSRHPRADDNPSRERRDTNLFKILDPHFHGNNEKTDLMNFCELIIVDLHSKSKD
jgi:hypothetical protein